MRLMVRQTQHEAEQNYQRGIANGTHALLRRSLLSECNTILLRGRVSSVGTATRYGLDGPGIESRRGRDFSD